MVQGKVKWFNDQKDYGFQFTESGKAIFVHYSVVQGNGSKTLVAREDVEFDIVNREKGEQARNVVKAMSYKLIPISIGI